MSGVFYADSRPGLSLLTGGDPSRVESAHAALDAMQFPEGLEDEIADALQDSIDMDWTSSDGARAVMNLFRQRCYTVTEDE